MVAQRANPQPVALASHLGTGLRSSCSIPDPATCSWPGKVVDDDPRAWAPAPM